MNPNINHNADSKRKVPSRSFPQISIYSEIGVMGWGADGHDGHVGPAGGQAPLERPLLLKRPIPRRAQAPLVWELKGDNDIHEKLFGDEGQSE